MFYWNMVRFNNIYNFIKINAFKISESLSNFLHFNRNVVHSIAYYTCWNSVHSCRMLIKEKSLMLQWFFRHSVFSYWYYFSHWYKKHWRIATNPNGSNYIFLAFYDDHNVFIQISIHALHGEISNKFTNIWNDSHYG